MKAPESTIAPLAERFDVRAEAARVTLDDARAAAEHFFPGGADQVKQLSGGFSNANFRIDTAKGPFVLRFFWAGKKTGEREVAVLKLCESHGIRVPRVFDFATDDQRTVALIECAEGEVFSELLLRRCDGADEIFAEAGRQLARTHAVTFASAGLFDGEAKLFHTFPSFPDECLNHLLAPLAGRGRQRLGDRLADEMTELARSHWGEVQTAYDRPRLTHCDFNPKNLILDARGQPVLIDWEFAMSADRLIDVGNFFRFEAEDYPASAKAAFVRGYESEGLTLPGNWVRVAKLVDLANMADFLGVEADYQKTFRTARIIVERTLAHFLRS